MVPLKVTSRSIYLCSFIYSLHKYLLNIYYMLSSVLGPRGTKVNQADNVSSLGSSGPTHYRELCSED